MCTLEQTLKVVEDMYNDTPTVVSIGTKYKHSAGQTILLDGRREYNPCEHRRDAFDMTLHYNLYVKKLEDGTYQAGVHDDTDTKFIHARPTVALTMAAYQALGHQVSAPKKWVTLSNQKYSNAPVQVEYIVRLIDKDCESSVLKIKTLEGSVDLEITHVGGTVRHDHDGVFTLDVHAHTNLVILKAEESLTFKSIKCLWSRVG